MTRQHTALSPTYPWLAYFESIVPHERPDTFSEGMNRIATWLESRGCTIDFYARDLEVAGRYEHETLDIKINDSSAVGALMILAHEAGHHVGWCIDPREHSYQRERQAFVYGFQILSWFAPGMIPRGMWIDFHREV